MVTTATATATATTKTAAAMSAPRVVNAVTSPATMPASYGTSWPPVQPLTAISANTSRAPEATKNSRVSRAQRHLSLPSSLPAPLVSHESFESLDSTGTSCPPASLASLRGTRRSSATHLSPQAAPGAPLSLSSDRAGNSRREPDRDTDASISVHRLRSNSGLALHTNSAALRRYIDYNQDGSTRLPPTGKVHDGTLPHGYGESGVNGNNSSNGSLIPPGAPDGPGLFSRETVSAVLQDPEVRRRLCDYARTQNNEENLEFLEKVQEYNKAVHGVVAMLADISTKFTGLAATDSLGLPQSLAKPLNADVMHVSRSVLPGLEMLFGNAAAYIEERIVRDIYPAFAKHQLSLRMKASLGAPSARTAQAPFNFTGLGHAFCLTDPYRPDNPVVYASDSFAHIIGYPRAEDIPRSGRCLSIPQPQGQQVMGDDITQEIVMNRRWWDKRPFWSHVSVCPLLSSRGHIRFALVSLVDVSSVVKSQDDILNALNCDSTVCCSSVNADSAKNSSGPPIQHKKKRPTSLVLDPHGTQMNGAPKSPKSAVPSSSRSLLNSFSRMRRSPGNTTSSEYRPPATEETKEKPRSPDSNLGQSKIGTSFSPIASVDDNLPMYSRFMLLQFVPGSSRVYETPGPTPPPRPMSQHDGRHNSSVHSAVVPAAGISANGSRFKVAYCSSPMLELLGLGSAAQDAVLYHDIFDVLSELAGSPSVTPSFRAAIQQRIAASEPASLELQIPAGGSPAPGAFSAGLGAGLASPDSIPADREDGATENSSRRARLFAFSRSKKHSSSSSERPRSSMPTERKGLVSSKNQRLMSHWTPLKDADGTIAWIALVISPLVSL